MQDTPHTDDEPGTWETSGTWETLDPHDWEATRRLAHRMVDDTLDHLAGLREQPVWRPLPTDVAATFETPPPRDPQGAEVAYEAFRETVLPYGMGNVHPRFWGWYMGAGTVGAALADFLASAMNPNLALGNNSSILVERQVVDWVRQIVGFPTDASGLLVSGGSMANFAALAVARQAAFADVRAEGLSGGPQLTVYASDQTHSSVQKAVELLGIGNRHLRLLPTRPDLTVDPAAVRAAIEADLAAGLRPMCIVGNAGTINTGAIDDLRALGEIAREENVWFHADGAIGGIAMLSDVVRPRLEGIESADSVSVDMHKWMHMPFEVGCLLVRDEDLHHGTFAVRPAYLAHQERGIGGGSMWFSEYGLQLSRQFRALKVWMSIKEHGLDRFGRMISRNVRQAHHLAELVAAAPQLEMMAPVGLDIVCFRYNPGDLDESALAALNEELLMQLQESGVAAPSYTTIGGRYCLRVAIANHRSRDDDFDLLAEEVVRLGTKIAAARG